MVDNVTKRSSCGGGGLFGLGVGLLFFAFSALATALSSWSASAASPLSLRLSLSLPSDSLAAILDDMLVLSLLVLPA